MAGNRVVARFRDGRVVKGSTTDFLPTRDYFHVQGEHGVESVKISDLKAVFFVRDLEGDPSRRDKNEFDGAKPVIGRKIRVQFDDGEVLVGTTQGYQPGRVGFFVAPADPKANHERCFVVTAATLQVELL
jgi:Family of unknown function (DUF6982)